MLLNADVTMVPNVPYWLSGCGDRRSLWNLFIIMRQHSSKQSHVGSSETQGSKRNIRGIEFLQRKYIVRMDDFFVKGLASPVLVEDLSRFDRKVWYLLHHREMHPHRDRLSVILDVST